MYLILSNHFGNIILREGRYRNVGYRITLKLRGSHAEPLGRQRHRRTYTGARSQEHVREHVHRSTFTGARTRKRVHGSAFTRERVHRSTFRGARTREHVHVQVQASWTAPADSWGRRWWRSQKWNVFSAFGVILLHYQWLQKSDGVPLLGLETLLTWENKGPYLGLPRGWRSTWALSP